MGIYCDREGVSDRGGVVPGLPAAAAWQGLPLLARVPPEAVPSGSAQKIVPPAPSTHIAAIAPKQPNA
jgi:hypothetical protein